MTNTSHEPKEQMPQKPVRIILPREVCTDPETAAKIMHGEIQKAEDAASWVGLDAAGHFSG